MKIKIKLGVGGRVGSGGGRVGGGQGGCERRIEVFVKIQKKPALLSTRLKTIIGITKYE